MIQRIKDMLLETRIHWAYQDAEQCQDRDEQRKLYAKAAYLQALRSSAQVERMEKAMGIR